MNIPETIPLDLGFNHLRVSYETLALISERSHLALIGSDPDTTLLVSSDWLLWQQLHIEGYDVVYIEQGYLDKESTKTLTQNLLIHANSWCEEDGQDITLFNGVSLGKAFSTRISFFLATYYRLSVSLNHIIQRFSPETLLFIDLRMNETMLMSDIERLICVESIAQSNDLKLINAYRPSQELDQDTRPPANAIFRLARAASVKIFEFTVSAISSVLKKPHKACRVPLIIQGFNLFSELITYKPAGSMVMLASSILPKKVGLTYRYLRNGVLFPSLTTTTLSLSETAEIDAMIAKLREAWATPADPRTEILGTFAKAYIFDKGKLHALAVDIKRIYRMLEKWRPSRVVADGIKNMPNYGYIACATQLNIPTDYIWHAPLAPTEVRLENLGCDGGGVMINRILSWGPMNEQWLDNIGAAPMPRYKIGFPHIIKYEKSNQLPLKFDLSKRGIICQYTVLVRDLAGRMGDTYYHFIRTVRALNAKGYDDVIFKLHPGYLGAMTMFTAIAEHFGLKCRILRFEPFDALVRSSDIAIGHLFSGSALDIVASKTPFVAAMFEPTDMNFDYFDGCENIARSVDELVQFIENDRFLDADKYLSKCFYNVPAKTCATNYWQAVLS